LAGLCLEHALPGFDEASTKVARISSSFFHHKDRLGVAGNRAGVILGGDIFLAVFAWRIEPDCIWFTVDFDIAVVCP